MKNLAHVGWLVPVVGMVVLGLSGATSTPGDTYVALDGSRVAVPAANQKLTVLFMTSTTCPVSKKYWPRLQEIEREFSAQPIAFAYANPYTTEKPTVDKSVASRYVVGEDLPKRFGAKTTAEAFVIDAAGNLLYRGAVDDQYGLTHTKPKPERQFLRDAIRAALAGKKIALAETEPAGCALGLEASVQAKEITFHNRIEPILQAKCQSCHHDGGIAPFALTSYAQVKERAPMIRSVVKQGIMPPWGAAPAADGSPSPWKHDRSLDPADKKILLDWLAGEMPKGDAKDAPAPVKFTDGWQIGKPDAIFQLPQPIAVKADGYMDYQFVVVPTGFSEDKWVDGIQIMPTDPSVVHHVLVWPISKKDMESGRKRPNFAEASGFFGGYVPGTSTITYEKGFGKKIPAGAGLLFQIHYTPNGRATRDQLKIGLRFCKETPTYEVRSTALANLAIDIPPGAGNHVETSQIRVPMDVVALSFLPHMHVRGKAFKYEWTPPGGKPKTLLDIPRYDFNWQLRYEFKEPLRIPRGSDLKATAIFDNSEDNPANPDPTKRVRWGDQTYEEMFLGYVEFYIPALKVGGTNLGTSQRRLGLR